ncbi:glycoside hydrolase family 5 protein [Alphaproteobacteria bacterium]|nr:glycoside hydrolase family 5 protein [Alphaproteobacteria bacterium]
MTVFGPAAALDKDFRVKYPIAEFEGASVVSRMMWEGFDGDPRSGVDEMIQLLNQTDIKRVSLPICVDYLIEGAGDCPIGTKNNSRQIHYEVVSKLVQAGYHVTIRFMPHASKRVSGSKITLVEHALRTDKKAVKKFVDEWRSFATTYKEFQQNQVSFNLINEPHYRDVKRLYLEDWLKVAIEAIDAIRSVSHDRIIIVPSIAKSMYANPDLEKKIAGFGPNKIIRKLPYDNLIYSFHSYEPAEYAQQGSQNYPMGFEWKKGYDKTISRNAEILANFANENQVPVILTEFGAEAFFDGKKHGVPTIEGRAKFADSYYNSYVENRGIGIAWWSLEKRKTLFQYCPLLSSLSFEGFNEFYPAGRVWDVGVLKSLKLFTDKTPERSCKQNITNATKKDKYDRSENGMKQRFQCLLDYGEKNGLSDLPSGDEVENFIANIQGNRYYRSHSQIMKLGISEKSMASNKHALVRLVNYEGTNEEFCKKPVL